MKLTLEQKAFYEYGRAVESLKRTIYETRETAIQEFKDPYRFLSTYDRKQLIDAMGLASEISAVRQKLQQLDNWQRLWMMREACITEEYLSSYIPCRAWNLTSPVRLPYAVPLSEIGLARPPQSWQYLTEEQAALLR